MFLYIVVSYNQNFSKIYFSTPKKSIEGLLPLFKAFKY